MRGGGGGVANWNVDTGGQRYDKSGHRVDGPTGVNPGDSAAEKQIQDLVKEMQGLDPKRFPGNPQMVEELHAKVLSDVDKLELQLNRNPEDAKGQVRTAKKPAVPAGYEDSVAEYYRRLGKGQ